MEPVTYAERCFLHHLSTMWEVLEEQMGVIPMYLKNGLTYSGYDNVWSLGALNDDTITQIEGFIKEKMSTFIQQGDDMFNFYHFYKSPKNFEIAMGHKLLLKTIAHYINSQGYEQFAALVKEKSKKKTTVQAAAQKSDAKPPKPVKIDVQEKKLMSMVNDWIRLKVQELNIQKNIEIETVRVTYDCSTSDSESSTPQIKGTVQCSFCHLERKVYANTSSAGTLRWVISNFLKHFKTHLREFGYVDPPPNTKPFLVNFSEDSSGYSQIQPPPLMMIKTEEDYNYPL